MLDLKLSQNISGLVDPFKTYAVLAVVVETQSQNIGQGQISLMISQSFLSITN